MFNMELKIKKLKQKCRSLNFKSSINAGSKT